MLGAVAQPLAIIVNSIVTSPLFDEMAAEALHRAANAGHAEAMFGISLIADSLPDPDFRMLEKPNFPFASQNMVDASYTSEILYWLGKAAANGSSRASLLMGLIYVEPEVRSLRDTHGALKFMKQAVSQGNGIAARGLNAYLDPRIIDLPQANCPQSMYYFALHERMQNEDGRLDMEKAGPILSNWSGTNSLTERFYQMRDEEGGYFLLNFGKVFFCLLVQRVAYEGAVGQSEGKKESSEK